jgi:transposase
MDTYTQAVPAKRRYIELEQKRRIVEETLAEGPSVARIARLHGVNANLVFNWRRLYRAGQLGGRGENKEQTLARTSRHGGYAAAVNPWRPGFDRKLSGHDSDPVQDVRVWVEGSADARLVRVVLECPAR